MSNTSSPPCRPDLPLRAIWTFFFLEVAILCIGIADAFNLLKF